MTGAAELELTGEGLVGGQAQRDGTADVQELTGCVEASKEGCGRGGRRASARADHGFGAVPRTLVEYRSRALQYSAAGRAVPHPARLRER
jgi:hypothetical protein